MKQNKKFIILAISILIIAIILFVLWHFKIFPFNEEQFRLQDETCFKTCINTTEQPYIRTTMLEKTMTPSIISPPKVSSEIPLAPTKTMTGAIPTPPVLNTPVTNLNVKPPMMDISINPLLSDIRKGISLKPTQKPLDNSIIPQAPTKTMTGAIPTPPILNTPVTNLNVKPPMMETSSNPLLDQIRKGVSLKPTSPMQKESTAKSSSLFAPTLQDEISKRITERRSSIEDDSDPFDEFFRYRRYGLY